MALASFAEVEAELARGGDGMRAGKLDSRAERDLLAAIAAPGVDHDGGHR